MTLKHVWKFSITPAEKSSIKIPRGGRILSVQAQRGEICLWALVDPAAEMIERTVRVIGTGWNITEDPGEFVGTVQLGGATLSFRDEMAAGAGLVLVFHVFAEPEAP